MITQQMNGWKAHTDRDGSRKLGTKENRDFWYGFDRNKLPEVSTPSMRLGHHIGAQIRKDNAGSYDPESTE